jgi:hypothetical protein
MPAETDAAMSVKYRPTLARLVPPSSAYSWSYIHVPSLHRSKYVERIRLQAESRDLKF